MNYFYLFLAAILAAGLLICLVWVLLFFLDSYRYRRAINRRMRQIDAEMRKRGGVL
jgi:hypothetical protein